VTLDELIEGLTHMRLMLGTGDVKVWIENSDRTTADEIGYLDDSDDKATIVLQGDV
jgi:hypothetical protein